MHRSFIYITFLLAVLGIGLLIGTVTRPDGWYAALAKPSFNPPNWVFAPVWSLLCAIIAIAGARTWESGPSRRPRSGRPAPELTYPHRHAGMLIFGQAPHLRPEHRPADRGVRKVAASEPDAMKSRQALAEWLAKDKARACGGP